MKKLVKYEKFMENSKINLPDDVIKISNAYFNAGKELFLVGGAVRDFVMGKTPKDWDLVTNALPEESKRILKDFRVSDEQGKNFGVIRVYTESEPEGYEIASYRKDIARGRDTKGDDQKVIMGSDITMIDDSQRRDLTLNAIYYDIQKGEIVDPQGGIKDIKSGVVRAVGDANQRFIEDRLRILRIFRFASRTGYKIDSETANSIKKDNKLRGVGPTDDVAQERIWDEYKKAWSQSKDFNYYLKLLTDFNMWGEIFPSVKINTDFIDSNNFIIVLSNLFKGNDLNGLESTLVTGFKIESQTAKKVIFLLSILEMKEEDILDIYRKKVSCSLDEQTIDEWLELNGVTDFRKKITKFKPSVNSQELMDMGFKGKSLGDEIKRLELINFQNL